MSDFNVGSEFSTNDHIATFFNINLQAYQDIVSDEKVFMFKGENESLRSISYYRRLEREKWWK